ncbi:MAG: HD domain-containing protein [Methanosarcinales archaeon]
MKSKPHVFRDPLHGYIDTDEKVSEIIDTPWFQRLRRIKQLGFTYYVYPTAEHTRFSHSLGCYHVAKELSKKLKIDNKAILYAALLHDIGHGPFSHMLEQLLGDHEEWTQRILLEFSDDIENIINYKEDFQIKVENIISILRGEHEYSSIISSQLDVDRLDYLLRDSYFVGVEYGKFDIHRLLHTLRYENGAVKIDYKGRHVIESYVLARYHMYQQVYFHHTTRGIVKLVESILKRAKEIYDKSEINLIYSMESIFNGKLNVENYLILDDSSVIEQIKTWKNAKDKILSDLCKRFLNRKLLKPIDIGSSEEFMWKKPNVKNKIKNLLTSNGYDPEYYLLEDIAADVPYKPYHPGEEESSIFMESKDKRNIYTIEEVSKVISVLTHKESVKRIYIPSQTRKKIETLIRGIEVLE